MHSLNAENKYTKFRKIPIILNIYLCLEDFVMTDLARTQKILETKCFLTKPSSSISSSNALENQPNAEPGLKVVRHRWVVERFF